MKIRSQIYLYSIICAFALLAIALLGSSFLSQVWTEGKATSTSNVAGNFSHLFLGLAGIIISASVVTAGIVEILKRLPFLRTWVQSHYLESWIIALVERSGLREAERPDQKSALLSLFDLAGTGDKDTLCDLPTEQLLGQINAAMEVVLEFPNGHEELLKLMAIKANKSDIEIFLNYDKSEQDKIDARARIANHVLRGLDELQIGMRRTWQLLIHTTSVLTGLVIVFISLAIFERGVFLNWSTVLTFFVLGALAGMAAPVVRDLIVGLHALRGRDR